MPERREEQRSVPAHSLFERGAGHSRTGWAGTDRTRHPIVVERECGDAHRRENGDKQRARAFCGCFGHGGL